MDFMKIMDLMNYNYESQGVEFYNIYNSFLNANGDILTKEQLENAKVMILSPGAFDDGRSRSSQEYADLMINLDNRLDSFLDLGKGMI